MLSLSEETENPAKFCVIILNLAICQLSTVINHANLKPRTKYICRYSRLEATSRCIRPLRSVGKRSAR